MAKPAIDWDAQPLGMEPDTRIAKRLGVGRNQVRIERARRKIPPWRSNGSLPYHLTAHVGENTYESVESFGLNPSRVVRTILDNVFGQRWDPDTRAKLLKGLEIPASNTQPSETKT